MAPRSSSPRHLARAVAAVRDEGRLPADSPPFPDVGIVQAFLPLPWIAELALAAANTGRTDGWRILQGTWPATRPTVVKLAANLNHRLRGTARGALARLPVPPTARYHLRLLGPVELRRDGALVDTPEWRRERVRALLAYLVLNGTANRERLAEELWPERDADAQSRNLRVTLTALLRVLEPDRGPRDVSFFIRQQGGNLTLHPGGWLDADVWELETVCQKAADADERGAPSVALDRGLQAANIWRSEPNELGAEPWAIAPIERSRRRFTTAVTRAGELLVGQGRHKATLMVDRLLASNANGSS